MKKTKPLSGLTEKVIHSISKSKKEPSWILEKRLQAFKLFQQTPLPNWGPDLKKLNFEKLVYFIDPKTKETNQWDKVPKDIKRTFDKLGIPEAEKNVLSGVGAQFDSNVVYHNLQKSLQEKGVIFENMDIAVKKYPDLVKKYFMTSCIPINDHKFIMLHAAVWSGGTFIYVPKNIKVELPLQAYFRMNAQRGGQFEHTLIILDEGAELHYIEGCSSPRYQQNALHAGGVEIFVSKNAKMRYTSIENWSKNVYNLNTKRALVYENAAMTWVNGNMGSTKTMLYPCSILLGEHANTESIGIAFAGKDQNQDTGTKVIHLAPNTTSFIQSKSISKNGGISSYRGLVRITSKSDNCKSRVQCDALILDKNSLSNTYPSMKIDNSNTEVSHEATVSKINDEQIFYLQSRGLSEEQALKMIISGFIEPIVKALPLEYAVELNKLIELEISSK
ncbi:Fe-S cluster assembly protein SufB [Candidatus Woesearchaeota archaeon]|nr:Fe-S cluster assembly protein SufB [Candidatus Woesearchaeota archaeon]